MLYIHASLLGLRWHLKHEVKHVIVSLVKHVIVTMWIHDWAYILCRHLENKIVLCELLKPSSLWRENEDIRIFKNKNYRTEVVRSNPRFILNPDSSL